MDRKPNAEEKIILPKNLQREMIKFFLKTSMPKLAKLEASDTDAPIDKEIQQTSKIQKEGC